jgi:putative membrane protein
MTLGESGEDLPLPGAVPVDTEGRGKGKGKGKGGAGKKTAVAAALKGGAGAKQPLGGKAAREHSADSALATRISGEEAGGRYGSRLASKQTGATTDGETSGGDGSAAAAGGRMRRKDSQRAPPQRMESMFSMEWLGESATFLGNKIQADEVKVRAREVERKGKGSVFTVPSYNVGKANRFRAQYDPQLWSTYMFTYHGTVFPHIILRVVMLTLFAAGVCAYDEFYHELPIMTTAMHQIAGAALSLFITFRTNSSYTRFYEAVHVFGLMTTVAQQCARQVLTLARGSTPTVRDSKVRIMRLLSVFPLACKRDLRAVVDKAELEHIWNDEAFLRLIDKVRDVPSAIVQAIGYHLHRITRESAITENGALHVDTSLVEMAKHWASLLKISSHPVPYVFAIEGSRMTVAFILTLPWVMVPHFGWYTVLATFLFSYELLAIEAIGAEIEDPVGLDFNDLPLEHMVFRHMELVTQLATAHEILREDHPSGAGY